MLTVFRAVVGMTHQQPKRAALLIAELCNFQDSDAPTVGASLSDNTLALSAGLFFCLARVLRERD
jgi:hypothetical protein